MARFFDDYIGFMGDHGLVPVSLEEIHYYRARLTQVDLIFIREQLLNKYEHLIYDIGQRTQV